MPTVSEWTFCHNSLGKLSKGSYSSTTLKPPLFGINLRSLASFSENTFLKNEETNKALFIKNISVMFEILLQNESFSLFNIFYCSHIALNLDKVSGSDFSFVLILLLCPTFSKLFLIHFFFLECGYLNFLSLGKKTFKQKPIPKQIKRLKCKIYLLLPAQVLPVQHLALCLVDKVKDW